MATQMNAKEHFKISLCNFTIAPGHSSISLVLFSFAGIEEQKYGPGTTMRCEMQPSATYIHDLKLHLLQSICFSRCSDTQSAKTQIIFFKNIFSARGQNIEYQIGGSTKKRVLIDEYKYFVPSFLVVTLYHIGRGCQNMKFINTF